MKKVYIQPITDSMELEEELVIATSDIEIEQNLNKANRGSDEAKFIDFSDDIDW